MTTSRTLKNWAFGILRDKGKIFTTSIPREPKNSPAWQPAVVTFAVLLALVSMIIWQADGDPLALARLGTRFSEGISNGTEGYDGQFVVYIARQPNPQTVAPLLDDPPYRYQRVLLPLLARGIALGNPNAIPWVLVGLGLLMQTVAVFLLAQLLLSWSVSHWFALIYGLWVGFSLAVRLDLPEPLAYGLVVIALWAVYHQRHHWSWLAYALALFAKEVIIFFILAQLSQYFWRREWKRFFGLAMTAGIPFVLFQVWIWSQFGRPGFGLGGAGVTGLEMIPYMGLWRIYFVNPRAFLAFGVVFVPFIVFPSVWGLVRSLAHFIRREVDLTDFILFWNAFSIAILTHSTFREAGGLLRFASGLVLAVLLYAARHHHQRALRYAPLWLVLNIFLLNG